MNRDGLGALLAWILGGALAGAALGYGVDAVFAVPLTPLSLVGLGAALGGGLGGLTNFLFVGEEERDTDTAVTVDMAPESEPGPRPADLFEDHPDPVLYVADVGAGPVVRAANEAYGATFDLPVGALEGVPLGEALRATDEAADLVDAVAAGESVDREAGFETADGTDQFRVRSVGNPEDGYLLFSRTDAA